jgi:putative ABC transport system ATP-binding protein
VPPLLLDSVSKTRGTGRHATAALRDVSLQIQAGEFVLLEGPSGAGKTTLLAVAAGLLTPDQGSVVLAGERVDRANPEARQALRARHVGFVFQRANLLPHLTARDNVALMGTLAGMEERQARRAGEDLLEELGLGALSDRRPNELSGGEEHRVALARAVVHRPAVLLADEPTALLDSAAGRAVSELLARLASARGCALLVATHDPRLGPFATRHVPIADGHLDHPFSRRHPT